MVRHLQKKHHCQLVYDGEKDWVVSGKSENKLELQYWCQPCLKDASLSAVNAYDGLTAEEAYLLGEHSSCHTIMSVHMLMIPVFLYWLAVVMLSLQLTFWNTVKPT